MEDWTDPGTNISGNFTFYLSHVLFPTPIKKPLTHGVNNEIQLPIVDCNTDVGCQQLVNNIDDRFHEVLSHVLKDIFWLTWLEPERKQVLTDEACHPQAGKEATKAPKTQLMAA